MTTTVHLLRHGEVHNPEHVLYGRLPDFHLSERGQAMAERLGSVVQDRDVITIISSPLDRAQETAQPAAKALGLEPILDERLIEAENVFEGLTVGSGEGALWRPRHWKHLRNPFRPSWGEPYKEIVARMRGAMDDAATKADGHEALLVSHQLPIWVTRLSVQGDRLWHDPRKRECNLASLTTFVYDDGGGSGARRNEPSAEIVSVSYSEPAADLLPSHDTHGSTFTAGA